MTVGRLLHEYLSLNDDDPKPWLKAPASAAEIAATEQTVGFSLPDDLKAIFGQHNGGRLLDEHVWLSCKEGSHGLAGATEHLQKQLVPNLRIDGLLNLVPGPHALMVTSPGETGVIYDPDLQSSRLLYLDVLAVPSIVPFARDLENLLRCYIAIARAGLVNPGPRGPELAGSVEELYPVFLAHDVAPIPPFGIERWLNSPFFTDLFPK